MRVIVFAVALVLACALAPTPNVRAEVCISSMPQSVAAARGYTYLGTLTARELGDDISTWTIAVERVYAPSGPPPTANGETLAVGTDLHLNGACGPMQHLVVGERYLVSDRSLTEFQAYNAVAWRVDGTNVSLVRMYQSEPFDHRLTRPETVEDAVALMVGQLPPTSSVEMLTPTKGGNDGPWLILMALGLSVPMSRRLMRRIARIAS